VVTPHAEKNALSADPGHSRPARMEPTEAISISNFSGWPPTAMRVLYTNPARVHGYGEKFLWATWGGWGKLVIRT